MNEVAPAYFQTLRNPSALFEQPGLYANGSTGACHKVPVKGIGCRGHALGAFVESPPIYPLNTVASSTKQIRLLNGSFA